jgi:hypothetical protein
MTAVVLLTSGALVGQEKEQESRCVCVGPGAGTMVWSELPHFQSFQFFGRRGRLGVYIDASQEEELNGVGARVTGVEPGGPADEAGIKEGDVILEVDGKSLLDPLDDLEVEEGLDLDESIPVQRLIYIARNLEPGEAVEVRYRRDGEVHTASLEAGEGTGGIFIGGLDEFEDFPAIHFRRQLDEEERARLEERMEEARERLEVLQELRGEEALEHQEEAMKHHEEAMRRYEEAMERAGEVGERLRLRIERSPELNIVVPRVEGSIAEPIRILWGGGLSLISLNPGLGEYFGTDEGVLVTDAEQESSLGLRAGDVILAIGGRQVRSPSQARKILRSYEEGEEVEFRVVRQQTEQTIRGTFD